MTFFWNKFTMRAALKIGADFAKDMSDTDRQETYSTAGNKVEGTLANHYQDGYVYETEARKKDAAVICAFNDGYLGDGLYAPTSKEVAGTISTLNDLFCSSFNVNQADTKAGTPGILYGRYAGDTYAGGNPWILLSAALAQLLYRGAAEMVAGNVALDEETVAAWSRALSIDSKQNTAAALAQAMMGAGDGVLLRIRKHVLGAGLHLAEQLDRATGQPMSAADLTWSYATVLKALHARPE